MGQLIYVSNYLCALSVFLHCNSMDTTIGTCFGNGLVNRVDVLCRCSFRFLLSGSVQSICFPINNVPCCLI